MPPEDPRDGREPEVAHPWSRSADEEPEPDWAEQIRQSRKARGERLKDVFATFDEPGPVDDVVGDASEDREPG